MSRDFVGALLQLNAEKQVSREALVRALEEGIQAAYRRVAGEEDIFVKVEAGSGEIRVYRGRIVVDEVENPELEISLADAREANPDIHVGAVLEIVVGEDHAERGALAVLFRVELPCVGERAHHADQELHSPF